MGELHRRARLRKHKVRARIAAPHPAGDRVGDTQHFLRAERVRGARVAFPDGFRDRQRALCDEARPLELRATTPLADGPVRPKT